MSNQLLRASLSVGANINEAQNAESKADFIHKMKISAKEADEVEFYLEVCNHSSLLPNCGELLEKIKTISRILNKIIASSKQSNTLKQS